MYCFPRTIWVRINTLKKQVDHICSEAEECKEVLEKEEGDLFRLAEELFDVQQSAESGLRIVQELKGEEFLTQVKNFVKAKNTRRGYYGDNKPAA